MTFQEFWLLLKIQNYSDKTKVLSELSSIENPSCDFQYKILKLKSSKYITRLQKIDEDVILKAVDSEESIIREIPKKFFTRKIVDWILNNDSYYYNYIPENFLDTETVFKIFLCKDYYLREIPKHCITQELFDKCVKYRFDAIIRFSQFGFVVEEFLNYDLFIELLKDLSSKDRDIISQISPFLTKEMIKALLEKNIVFVCCLKHELITFKMVCDLLKYDIRVIINKNSIPIKTKKDLDVYKFIPDLYTKYYKEQESYFNIIKSSLKQDKYRTSLESIISSEIFKTLFELYGEKS